MSKKRKNRQKREEEKMNEESKKNPSTIREIFTYVIVIILAVVLAAHLSVVVSGSMEPSFYRGDIVATQNVNTYGIQEFNPYTDVEINDVVVYNAKWYSEPVIHRVINIQEINGTKYYIIKGDNNEVADPYPVTPDQIKAKVITIGDSLLVIPQIGQITLFFRGL